ncbi:hypothetical protein L9F63_023384 [Diploptera punctata]|uniref:Uncharacterized protein n=1 Tax=Diploptera punctata TaxID=6984 RepID=A0AAD7ZJF6_DIPPU|nr:hypothetical protein L9F63_023384 [Diploptera punctata]
MKDLYTKAPITRYVGEKRGESSQSTTTRKPPLRIVVTSSSSSSSVPSSFSSTYSSSSSAAQSSPSYVSSQASSSIYSSANSILPSSSSSANSILPSPASVSSSSSGNSILPSSSSVSSASSMLYSLASSHSLISSTDFTSSAKEDQTKPPPNHSEEYHEPYNLQYGYETDFQTEHTTTTTRYKYRPNYPHRRRRPTTSTSTEQPTTSMPEKYTLFNYKRRPQTTQTTKLYEEEPPIQVTERTTKLIPVRTQATTKMSTESPVSTVYPDKTNNFKTTYQYYHEPKSTTVHETVTTVYPQNSRTRLTYTTPTYVDAVKPSGGEINNYYTSRPNTNRRRTKPTGTVPTTTTTVSAKAVETVRTTAAPARTTLLPVRTTAVPVRTTAVPVRSTTVPVRTNVFPVRTTTVSSWNAVPVRTTFTTSTAQTSDVGFDLPNEMKDVLVNFNIDDHLPKPQPTFYKTPGQSPMLFITPITEAPKDNSVPNYSKYNSQYSASELMFDTVTTEKPLMRDEVKEILASIGLYPDKSSETTTTTIRTTRATTTSTETPDIEAAAESFSPEMKDLLISFGLLPSANDIQHPTIQEEEQVEIKQPAYDQKAASPVIDPSSYLNFKPLPTKYAMSSDMKQFLASFGLVSSGPSEDETYSRYRSQKSLNIDETINTTNDTDLEASETNKQETEEKMPKINTDVLSSEMIEVLENLGLYSSENMSSSEIKEKTYDDEGHIFNPSAHLAAHNPTEEEAAKLAKLLDTIKKLMKHNATISQDEIDALNATTSYKLPPIPNVNIVDNEPTFIQPMFVKKQANKTLTLDEIKNVPDPLSPEELGVLVEEYKNEVKRQQPNITTNITTSEETATNNTTSEETATNITIDSDSTTTTVETPRDTGPSNCRSEANVDDALPPRKPNGLYFLLDWNSFLQVDGDNRKINLQFNPKLGNSRAFQPVSVP